MKGPKVRFGDFSDGSKEDVPTGRKDNRLQAALDEQRNRRHVLQDNLLEAHAGTERLKGLMGLTTSRIRPYTFPSKILDGSLNSMGKYGLNHDGNAPLQIIQYTDSYHSTLDVLSNSLEGQYDVDDASDLEEDHLEEIRKLISEQRPGKEEDESDSDLDERPGSVAEVDLGTGKKTAEDGNGTAVGLDGGKRPVSPHGREKFDDLADDFNIHESCSSNLSNEAQGTERIRDDLSKKGESGADTFPDIHWQTVADSSHDGSADETFPRHAGDEKILSSKDDDLSKLSKDAIDAETRGKTAAETRQSRNPELLNHEVPKPDVSKYPTTAEAKNAPQDVQKAKTPVEPEDKKVYYIYNVGLGHCLDVPEGRSYEGRPIIEYEMNGGKNQQFRIERYGEHFMTIQTIIPDGSDRYGHNRFLRVENVCPEEEAVIGFAPFAWKFESITNALGKRYRLIPALTKKKHETEVLGGERSLNVPDDWYSHVVRLKTLKAGDEKQHWQFFEYHS